MLGAPLIATHPHARLRPPPPGLKTWHTLTFSVDSAFSFSATLDGARLFSDLVDPNPPAGMDIGFSGLGSGWHRASFDNFGLERTLGSG